MTTHTHYCPRCRRDKECPLDGTTWRGACIFPSSSDITCEECAWENYEPPARTVPEQTRMEI